jgi:hypothetical protein
MDKEAEASEIIELEFVPACRAFGVGPYSLQACQHLRRLLIAVFMFIGVVEPLGGADNLSTEKP